MKGPARLACGLVALLCATAAPATADVSTTAITLIPAIQGSTAADPNGAGYVSPLVGQTVTIEGVVTGHDDENGATDANPTPGFAEDRGIFVQEEVAEADSDPQSSEGIFVGAVLNPLSYPIGNRVQVTGIVAERFDHTQINVTGDGQPTDLGAAMLADIPAPVTLDEATAEAQNVLAADIPGDCEFPADVCREGRRSYYERFEGMLVNLPVGVANSGGVDRAAELFVTPGPQLDPVLVAEDPPGTSDAGVRGLIGATNDAGSGNPLFPLKDQTSTTNLPVDHQDQVLNLRGPLAFGAANYKIVPQAGALPVVLEGPTEYPFSRVPVQPADTLRATFFNVEDFFVAGGAVDGSTVTAAEYETKRDRIADAIDRLLKRPDVVGVEEVGGLSNASTGLAALQDLATTLGGYTAHLLRGRDDRFLDVGYLIKDGVTATNLRQLGLDADESIAGTNCSDAPPRLYDRPPLAIDLVKGGLDVTAIVNHFAEREAPGSCRVAQAAFLEDEVAALQTAGREVIVGGDLNAMEFESALDELTDGETTLTNLVEQLPATDRYSFQSLGRLQLLDHLLVTGGLVDAVADVRIAHFDTEYYDRTLINAGAGCGVVTPPAVCTDGHKASDHDPPLVTLNLPAPTASTYAELVDADDPRGYWRFGEPSGPALTDSSGNGNHGTYLGGPALGVPGALAGDANTAVSFDGVNDTGRVPDSSTLHVGTSFSLEGWVKRSSTAKSHQLMLKGNGFHLVVMNQGSGNEVWLRKANVTTLARSNTGILADGLYHHVVATIDGPGSTARIYIDGVDRTAPSTAPQSVPDTTFPLNFGIGATTEAKFDEFALYDQVLSAQRVAEHRAAAISP